MAERSFDWKSERNLLPALTAAMAVLVLFPLLGTYGLWEPHEINVADAARKLANEGDYWALLKSKPPLSTWLMAFSLKIFGVSEFAARLPMALMGMITLLATTSFGATFGKPRAGLYAAIVLLASPLFVFESRQLTSDVAQMAAVTVAMLGLVRLLWVTDGRSPGSTALDAACAASGLVLGFFAGGLLLGVFVPLVVVCIAALVATMPKGDAETNRKRLMIGAAVTGALALLSLGIVLVAIYDWVPAQAGKTAIFGKSLTVVKGYSIALGGTWKDGAVGKHVGFDWIVNQVAFGMFPWSALAPLAVLRLALSPSDDETRRLRFGGFVMLIWALVAYLVATIWLRKVGMLRFSALVPIAFAVGVWIDRRHGDTLPWQKPTKAHHGLPLVALFVFAAAVQLSRDIAKFPDELGSVHLLAVAKFPAEASYLRWIVLIIGLVFAVCVAAGFGVDSGDSNKKGIFAKMRRASQYGVWAALGLSVIFALFLSFVFTPGMSEHFSYKNVFNSYIEHRKDDEKLGVLGIPESGAAYYSRGNYETIAGRSRLYEFLAEKARVFVVTRAAELCPAHQAAANGKFNYHVIDNSNSRFLLLSNQLAADETDQNPLLSDIMRTPPASISRQASANFEDTIELIGFDMPDSVSGGSKFTVSLYYKVLRKPRMNYKVFMHFDGCGTRFQGDHDPIRGRCGTIFWQPGDYIVDTVEVTAGGLTHSGMCTLKMGFFTGSAGRWRNMTVNSGNGDKVHRVTLGNIRVE